MTSIQHQKSPASPRSLHNLLQSFAHILSHQLAGKAVPSSSFSERRYAIKLQQLLGNPGKNSYRLEKKGPDGVSVFQLQLFQRRPRRDLEAADRALARLRAEFGPESVVQVKMQPGHLPEAQFSFEPLNHTKLPGATRQGRRTLVRRIFIRPTPMTVHPVGYGKNFCATDASGGPFRYVQGPYILSGGWWHREIHREYYFAWNDEGKVLWIYLDKGRRRWFMHGKVE